MLYDMEQTKKQIVFRGILWNQFQIKTKKKKEIINSENREQNLTIYIQLDFYRIKLCCFTFNISPSINFSFVNSILQRNKKEAILLYIKIKTNNKRNKHHLF